MDLLIALAVLGVAALLLLLAIAACALVLYVRAHADGTDVSTYDGPRYRIEPYDPRRHQ